MATSNESDDHRPESAVLDRVARERQEAIVRHRQQLAPVIDELHAAGFSCATLDELRTSRTVYATAIPILVRWLPRVADDDAKESIVHTLSVPWARPLATRALLDEFHKAPREWTHLKWAIGSAMEVIADPDAATEIASIVADRSHGKTRQMFVLALGKLDHRASIPMLITLLEDDDVAGHAVIALGKMAAQSAVPRLERLATSGRPWVRREAVKALKRIATIRTGRR